MVVEDGAGLANADALISVAYADAYHLARGNAWSGTQPEKEQAIVRATDYMDAMDWAGERLTDTQSLAWPRSGLGVPDAIKRACAEYALRARADALEQDSSAVPTVVAKSSQLGPLQKSVTYSAATSPRGVRRSFPAADRLIEPYLVQSVSEVFA